MGNKTNRLSTLPSGGCTTLPLTKKGNSQQITICLRYCLAYGNIVVLYWSSAYITIFIITSLLFFSLRSVSENMFCLWVCFTMKHSLFVKLYLRAKIRALLMQWSIVDFRLCELAVYLFYLYVFFLLFFPHIFSSSVWFWLKIWLYHTS